MSFFKKLGALFGPQGDSRNLWIYVRCQSCQEIMKSRVDLHNDLSLQFDEGGKGTSYFCRKVLVGSQRCYRPIEVELFFDQSRKLMRQEIKGGDFVSEREYLAENPPEQPA